MASPVVSSISPTQGPPAGGTTVTVTGTDFAGTTAVKFGSSSAASFTVISNTQIVAVTPAGTGAVNVTVTTSQGTSTQTATYTYVPAPTLSSSSPTQGPVSGGSVVTLTGTNLSGATAVRFDAIAATSFTVNSATQITAVSPAHAAGAAAVTVTNVGGTSNPLSYNYLSAPTLTSLNPAQGPTYAGSIVTLTGTNLTTTTSVQFGSTPASFTVLSPTQITAVVPAGSAGAATVTVTTTAGSSNGLTFTRVAAPAI